MEKDAKIYVAGHRGMVGSAILRALKRRGFHNFLLRTHSELDLTSQAAVNALFAKHRPEYIFLAAAKVGGIVANSNHPAKFFYDNIMIQTNILHAAYLYGAKKALCLGSSCIYPREAEQPIREDALLSGALEPTNEAYAIAKIASVKMCDYYRKEYGCDFISIMPTNLYGDGDNYDLQSSHVLPALIRKFHDARQNGGGITLWGTGEPLREFLHADDMADAALFAMENYSDYGHLNVGSSSEISIRDLAEMVRDVVGYEGTVEWDSTKPDGTPRKLMDSSRLYNMGWSPTISLREGVERTYKEFKINHI